MNAIESNFFTDGLVQLGHALPLPRGIIMFSAHWLTRGTWVTAMAKPQTIHDFSGFPDKLYQIQYPAPGSPSLAHDIQALAGDIAIERDESQWGLDHGTWSLLKHIYPDATIPVVQISLDMSQPAAFHFELGKKLRSLREKGILILGSGNIVHNLSKIQWQNNSPVPKEAIEFDAWAKEKLMKREFSALISEYALSDAGKWSVPTPDHYYPLLSVCGAAADDDPLAFDLEGFQNAAISMRSVRFGKLKSLSA